MPLAVGALVVRVGHGVGAKISGGRIARLVDPVEEVAGVVRADAPCIDPPHQGAFRPVPVRGGPGIRGARPDQPAHVVVGVRGGVAKGGIGRIARPERVRHGGYALSAGTRCDGVGADPIAGTRHITWLSLM